MWHRKQRSELAVDIGRSSVGLCQLERAGPHVRVRHWSLLEDLRRGPIREVADAGPRQDSGGMLSLERAGRLIHQWPRPVRRATLALQPPDVNIAAIAAPDALSNAPPEQWQTLARFEAARHEQCDPDELEVDYWRLPPGNRTGPNTLICAVRRRVIEEWSARFEALGLELGRVDILPLALLRTAWRCGLPEPQEAPERSLWGVLDLGCEQSLLVLALGSQCIYVRSPSVTGASLTQVIATSLNVDLAVADALKRRYVPPLIEPDPDSSHPAAYLEEVNALLHGVVRKQVLTLAGEISRAFFYGMESYPAASPAGLYLCGGGARLAQLPEMLEELMGIRVHRLDPRRGVEAETLSANDAVVLAGCLGLALGDVE